MQITVLSCWHLFPADNGAKQRALMLVSALAEAHTIDLIVLDASGIAAPDPGPLATICRSITTLSVPLFGPHNARERRGYLSLTPRSLVLTDTPAVTALLAERIAQGRCDAVFCACADLRAGFYGLKVAGRVPVIIDELEPSRYVDAERHASGVRARARAGMTAWKYQQFIRTLLGACAGCFLSSAIEAELIRRIAPGADHIAIVPNGTVVDCEPRYIDRDPHRLVYSGSPTYAPNLDAVRYFADYILPRIRTVHPDAWLAVTGEISGTAVADLAARPDVTFTGWLSDIRAYVAGSRVCIVPLRHGGGTRLKILEAMAVGTPVVATPKGAEGLLVHNGDDILIEDTPEAFARATERLVADDALHARIADRARITVTDRYDWKRIGADACDAFADFVDAWRKRHPGTLQAIPAHAHSR